MNLKIKQYLIISVFLLFLTGCASSSPIKKTDFCMDTYISITVYRQKDEALIDEAFARCHAYEALLSKTMFDSDISRLEENRFDYIEIAPETQEIISIYKSLYAPSEQMLDCTVGALTEIWDFHDSGASVLPDETAIEAAVASINAGALILEGNTACLASEDAMLDFGAIAKGYISGKIRDFLVENGVKSAILDFGGNIVVIGKRPDGNDYHIGIQKPFSDQNDISLAVSVSDQSVITAGVYQRYFEYEGKIYHHILNPKTGSSVDSDLLSATILCDDPALGDAYSTICILLGKDKALSLINHTDDMEGIFITKDYETIFTDHAKKFINED